MSSCVTDRSPHFSHIDALRAVAALLVVWTHCAEVFVNLTPNAANAWMSEAAHRFDFGRIGVVAFFGISGFLIPNSIKPGRKGAAHAFLVSRFFRLFPAYWLSVLLAFAVIWLPFGRTPTLMEGLVNLTMLPELLGGSKAPAMGLYWTLQIELLFYALCLAMLLAGVLRWGGAMAAGLTICLGLFAGLLLSAVGFGLASFNGFAILAFNLSVMFLGAVWRRWLERKAVFWMEWAVLWGAIAVYLLLLPAFGLFMLSRADDPAQFWFRFPVSYGLGVALFLVSTSAVKICWPPLVRMGAASYSLYLMHPVVLYGMVWLLEHRFKPARADVLILTLLAAMLSVALAFIVHRWVEQPAIALGRRIIARRSEPQPASAAYAAP